MSEEEKYSNRVDIGGISNYYGGLSVTKDANGFYWGIENYDGTYWEEIPKHLYDKLMEFRTNDKTND